MHLKWKIVVVFSRCVTRCIMYVVSFWFSTVMVLIYITGLHFLPYKTFFEVIRTSSVAFVVVGDHVADLWFCNPDQ